MAKPLTELLKKDQLFVWTPVHEHAFNLLKQALSTAPVLALPNFSLPFHIETMLRAQVLALFFTSRVTPLLSSASR